MKVDLTDLSPVKKRLSIEVSPEELDQERRTVLAAYARRAKIPGFRPGKTPVELIQARFAKEVEEDVRERIVTGSFERAAREKGLRPVGEASVEDLTHEDGQPLAFKMTFEVLPQIEAGGYRAVEVKRPSSRITDAEIDRALEELRAASTRFVYEPGRAAQAGDLVVVDLTATPAEGSPMSRERQPLEVGAPGQPPELNAKLTGAVEDAEITYSVEHPAGQHPAEWAGQRVDYRIHVHEVKRREVPPLDDDLAREVGGDFQSLAELRERLSQDLGARKAHQAKLAVRQAILDKVLLANTTVLPEVLVEREVRRRLEELARGLLLQGVDLEHAQIDWNELRKRQEEPARKAVHSRIVLDAIAAAEGLSVDPREVNERIRAEAERSGESFDRLRAEIEKQHGVQPLRAQMLREKTLDYLTSIANIQDEE